MPLVFMFALAAMLPLTGRVAEPVTVKDTSDRPRTLGDGKPVLVIYEDQDGGKENQRAKEVLARVNSSAENRAKVEALAVADLSKWDWWPARGHALADVKKAEKRSNTVVFVDWKGTLRKSWGLGQGRSNLVLVGADRRVLWASAGTLDDAQVEELLAKLRALGVDTAVR